MKRTLLIATAMVLIAAPMARAQSHGRHRGFGGFATIAPEEQPDLVSPGSDGGDSASTEEDPPVFQSPLQRGSHRQFHSRRRTFRPSLGRRSRRSGARWPWMGMSATAAVTPIGLFADQP